MEWHSGKGGKRESRKRENYRNYGTRELYSRYIDGEYYMALDFNEYKWRMENAGTKIVK